MSVIPEEPDWPEDPNPPDIIMVDMMSLNDEINSDEELSAELLLKFENVETAEEGIWLMGLVMVQSFYN